MNQPKVSIIIPAVRIGKYIEEAIKHYENLEYDNFEIIIVVSEENFTDKKLSDKIDIKIVPGPRKLSAKRDIGVQLSKGEVIAFIDDDAYPRKDWLKNAIEILYRDEKIGVVGGPAITPEDEPFLSKISGYIYSSPIVSGNIRKKFTLTNESEHEYDDIHGVNYIVKKEVFNKVEGFKGLYQYTSGEDSLFSIKIKKAGYKMIFSPNVVVYHHRRTIFFDHFKQVANYAFHRGFFAKKFPENSLKIKFFLPSIFLLGIVSGAILSLFSDIILKVYISTISIYFLLTFIFSLRLNPIATILTALGTFFTHLTYGFYFIKGFLTKEYKEEEKYYKKMILSQKRFNK